MAADNFFLLPNAHLENVVIYRINNIQNVACVRVVIIRIGLCQLA